MTTVVKEITRSVVPVLKKYGIKRASIYGSFARGEQRPDSDVDLLVDLSNADMGMFKYMRFLNELEECLKRNVDIITDSSMSPYMRANIEKDLTPIYEGIV